MVTVAPDPGLVRVEGPPLSPAYHLRVLGQPARPLLLTRRLDTELITACWDDLVLQPTFVTWLGEGAAGQPGGQTRAATVDAGHAVVDREPYLPHSWIDDPVRCPGGRRARGVGFAAKPAVATEMTCRALDAGCRRRGWLAMRSTASGSAAPATAPMPSSGGSRPGRGGACRPAPAPRATACTSGCSGAWTTTARRPWVRRAPTGCWCAATAPPASWPSTAATLPPHRAGRPGPGRRPALDGRGSLAGRQGPGRTHPPPGTA
jgi:hypothetical protein